MGKVGGHDSSPEVFHSPKNRVGYGALNHLVMSDFPKDFHKPMRISKANVEICIS
jgi:hypothetical protein